MRVSRKRVAGVKEESCRGHARKRVAEVKERSGGQGRELGSSRKRVAKVKEDAGLKEESGAAGYPDRFGVGTV